MSSRQHLGFAIALLVAIVGLGGLLLVWPAYRDAASIDRRVHDLRRKGENYDAQAREIARLTTELDELHEVIKEDLKRIPESSDIAGLMRVLSLPVDDVHVRDQTFTAGTVKEAVAGTELPTRVQPLTIEMHARFDAIFALIRSAESMDRLLRISAVNITCDRRRDEDQPFATASIVLEAVFDPPREDS